jgi:hypothetical protein
MPWPLATADNSGCKPSTFNGKNQLSLLSINTNQIRYLKGAGHFVNEKFIDKEKNFLSLIVYFNF